MGKRSPSPPPAPDPGATAAAQGAANKEAVRESALVNQIGEQGPFGTLRYTGDIGTPERTRITELSPSGQIQLSQRNQLAEILGGKALERSGELPTGPLTFEGIPDPGINDFSADAQRVGQDVYNRANQLFEPDFAEQRRALASDLAARGITEGGEAYIRENDRLDRSQNRARQEAALQGALAGGAEQQRLYNLSTQDRGRRIAERTALRAQPLNELSAFLQGAPATPAPSFGPQAQYSVPPADVAGAIQNAYLGQLNAYNQANALRNAQLGGIYGLAGTAATIGAPYLFGRPTASGLLSDRRLKTDVRRVGETRGGIPIYSFRYVWGGPTILGVMADEAERVFPEAVGELAGFKTVNYELIQ